MEFVHEVVHDMTQTLSNHHPSLIKIAMQPLPRSNPRKTSYFKLDVNELKVESMVANLKHI